MLNTIKTTLPAIIGGTPQFHTSIPLTKPSLTLNDSFFAEISKIVNSGMLSNASHVEQFEHQVSEYLGVDHVVAVSNCTTGLMLAIRCLHIEGKVILPSFTFMASGHAVVWNSLEPYFSDSELSTCNLDPNQVSKCIDRSTSAILATHIFGTPIDITRFESLAKQNNLPLIIDAAHGFGGQYSDGSKVGTKGTAEVFSLSPTKPLSTGEGGLITTNDEQFARELRSARNYGNDGNYDCSFVGLNGRMNEFSALIGHQNLTRMPELLQQRHDLVEIYKTQLQSLPGISLQEVGHDAVSSYKDFSIRIDSELFGMTRDTLGTALRAEGIPTRNYFDPPMHRQTAYRKYCRNADLPVADRLSAESITLPLYTDMPIDYVQRISSAIAEIHKHSDQIGQTIPKDTDINK